MKTIGIYDPYFHILGGAERYVLSIAQCFPDAEVILFGVSPDQLHKASVKFGMVLKNIASEKWISERNQRRKMLHEIEQFFYVTDGSLFFPSAKKNSLIRKMPMCGMLPYSNAAPATTNAPSTIECLRPIKSAMAPVGISKITNHNMNHDSINCTVSALNWT